MLRVYSALYLFYIRALRLSPSQENLIANGQQALIEDRWVKVLSDVRRQFLILLAARSRRKKMEARLQTSNRASLTRRLRQHIHHLRPTSSTLRDLYIHPLLSLLAPHRVVSSRRRDVINYDERWLASDYRSLRLAHLSFTTNKIYIHIQSELHFYFRLFWVIAGYF